MPAPTYEEGHGLQALVCNLDASPYLGRLALCRVINGNLERGQRVASDGRARRHAGVDERVRLFARDAGNRRHLVDHLGHLLVETFRDDLLGVHDGDDRVEHHELLELRDVQESLRDGLRVGRAGGLDEIGRAHV